MSKYDKFMIMGMYIAALSDVLIAAGVWIYIFRGG